MHFIPVHRALAALATCAALAFAQTHKPGEQAPASDVIRVDVELVNLLSTVQDRSGAYITNLSQEDFTVLEDGRRQPITHFARQTDQALTVGPKGSFLPLKAVKRTSWPFNRVRG